MTNLQPRGQDHFTAAGRSPNALRRGAHGSPSPDLGRSRFRLLRMRHRGPHVLVSARRAMNSPPHCAQTTRRGPRTGRSSGGSAIGNKVPITLVDPARSDRGVLEKVGRGGPRTGSSSQGSRLKLTVVRRIRAGHERHQTCICQIRPTIRGASPATWDPVRACNEAPVYNGGSTRRP